MKQKNPYNNIKEVGEIIGDLTIISYLHSTRNKKRVYSFKCVCGGERIAIISNIINSKYKCCINCAAKRGKRGIQNLLPDGLGAKRHVINAIKQSAKYRDIKYNLTEDEAIFFISKNCYYCDDPPKSIVKEGSKYTGIFYYNGIDRVDNNIGYEKSNCVTSCYQCNIAKSTLSKQEFLDKIKKIYLKHLK